MTSRVGDQPIYEFGAFRLDPDRASAAPQRPASAAHAEDLRPVGLPGAAPREAGPEVCPHGGPLARHQRGGGEPRVSDLLAPEGTGRRRGRRGADPDGADEGVPLRRICSRRYQKALTPPATVRAAPVARRRRTSLLALIAAIVLLVSAAAAWLLLRSVRHAEPAPPPHVVPFAALEGPRGHPTFSPDGEQVAFEWNGARHDNSDIYVTLVGSSDIRRLTTDPSADSNPTWSPDGRQIAFLRERPDGTTIQLVSPLGGADRKLGDFRGADSIGWSSDSQWLAAGRSRDQGIGGPPRGIYLIPVDGGDPRPLIASSALVADSNPAFSPDGRRLAYMSCSHDPSKLPAWFRNTGRCDLYLVELNPARTPSAPPRRLTTQRLQCVGSVTWTRDGSGVVYAAGAPAQYMYLWRVEADGTRPPERIEVAGSAGDPAVALTRDRLAFVRDLV